MPTKHDIKADCLGFPPEDVMSEAEGLPENRSYGDVRGGDVDTFRHFYDAEADYFEALRIPGADPDSDELYDLCGIDLMGLDPGVASSVAALSVIGACPITSCSGDEGHAETVPCVVFWCEAKHLDMILPAANAAGVTVKGIPYCEIPPTGVAVHVESYAQIERMREFARELIERWERGQT